MDIDKTLDELKQATCPYRVDVVDSVMAAVGTVPTLKVVSRRSPVTRWSITAAAALVLAVLLNVTLLYTHDYNEAEIGNMMAGVYSYGYAIDNSDNSMFEFVESFCEE